jgi:hypothetical protein
MPRRTSSFKPSHGSPFTPFLGLEPYPHITEYTAELMNGTRIRKKIHLLDPLLAQVKEYGPYTLRKLILRFTRSTYDSYYFPYQAHNIVLERTHYDPYYFRIQFYHYYTVLNECITIPPLQQYYDYCALEHFLYQHPVFYQAFYAILLRPMFPTLFSSSSSAPQPHGREMPNVSTS